MRKFDEAFHAVTAIAPALIEALAEHVGSPEGEKFLSIRLGRIGLGVYGNDGPEIVREGLVAFPDPDSAAAVASLISAAAFFASEAAREREVDDLARYIPGAVVYISPSLADRPRELPSARMKAAASFRNAPDAVKAMLAASFAKAMRPAVKAPQTDHRAAYLEQARMRARVRALAR